MTTRPASATAPTGPAHPGTSPGLKSQAVDPSSRLSATAPAVSNRPRVSRASRAGTERRASETAATTQGRFTRKIARQPPIPTRRPPTGGPPAAANPMAEPSIPKTVPRRSCGRSSRTSASEFGNTSAPVTAWRTREDNEHAEARSNGGTERHESEGDQPRENEGPTPQSVAQLAGEWLERGLRDQIAADEPGRRGNGYVEIVDDVGQRYGDHRRVERQQHRAERRRGEHGTLAGSRASSHLGRRHEASSRGTGGASSRSRRSAGRAAGSPSTSAHSRRARSGR